MDYIEYTPFRKTVRPNRTIFVVDGDDLVGSTLCLILKAAGFNAFWFYSAETAMQKIDEYTPHLLISEVFLPGAMSGIELAELFAVTSPEIAFILLSGDDFGQLLRQAEARGSLLAVHQKPMHPRHLLEMVEARLAEDAKTHLALTTKCRTEKNRRSQNATYACSALAIKRHGQIAAQGSC